MAGTDIAVISSILVNMDTDTIQVKVYKLVEVAEHNKSKGAEKSIWTVIHDKVYDITKFLDEVSGFVKELVIHLSIYSFSTQEGKRF